MSSADRHTPRVHDVMTRNPLVVHGDDDAEPLLVLFEGRDFNAVPVVDAEGHLVGVVTKLSLLRLFRGGVAAATAEPAGSSTLRIRDVMDTRKVSVEPTDDLDAVVRQMTRYHVRSVPVVERFGSQRRLVGMVSRGDLLRGIPSRPASTEAEQGD
jgi:CBS domain-containing membrane protein